MSRLPFFGYPYSYPYYRYYNSQRNHNHLHNKEQKDEKQIIEENKSSITDSNEISNTTNSRYHTNDDQAIFEIFGIKLYLDDLIILGILFFLYQQNVKDEMLYIILFLLLFS